MNNKLFIVCVFILTILMVSAVSASQENMTSEDLTTQDMDEKTFESIDESEMNEDSTLKGKGAEIYFESSIDGSTYIISDERTIIDIYTSKEVAKDTKIYLDDKQANIKIDTVLDESPFFAINFEEYGLKEGLHNITFKYPGNSKIAPITKTFQFNLVTMIIHIPKSNFGEDRYVYLNPTFSDGTVTILCDGKLLKKTKLTDDDSEGIPLKTGYGVHNIEVKYECSEGNFSKSGTYEYCYFGTSIENDELVPWQTLDFTIWGPSSSKKKITIKINNKKYQYRSNDYDLYFKISKNLLKNGKNTIIVTYPGDDKYPRYTKTITFNVIPNVIIPQRISNSNTESIVFETPKAMKIKYDIYQISKNGINGYKKIKSGTTKSKFITIPKLSNGYHAIRIVYTTENGITMETEEYIEVMKNSNGFKSSISTKNAKVGSKITVKIKSPKLKTNAKILIDEKKVQSASLKNGKATIKFSVLTPGKHKVTVYVEKGKKFYSKVYYIKIKERPIKLSFKTVQIKKSSKKLVLQASLKKKDGKMLKGKKITFKFNGKTFKAKTNLKGIAKVSIKKSMLKKLKVGKKVKYSASYQYTIEKIAKVKK